MKKFVAWGKMGMDLIQKIEKESISYFNEKDKGPLMKKFQKDFFDLAQLIRNSDSYSQFESEGLKYKNIMREIWLREKRFEKLSFVMYLDLLDKCRRSQNAFGILACIQMLIPRISEVMEEGL